MAGGAGSGLLVAVPWAGSCPHRRAALEWVTTRWEQLGHRPVLGTHTGGPWVKARAVANAIADTSSDILVISDADVWTDGITDAIEQVQAGAPWAIPHHWLYRLSRDATADVLAGHAPHAGMPLAPISDDIPGFAYPGLPGGGTVVLRRGVYETCPLDPRFADWGHEDEAWALALRCLYGPATRTDSPMWHLWHPPQRNHGTGSTASAELFKRYLKARRRPERMRALINEAR